MDTSDRFLSCDTTSLLDLKAELYRKQEACKLAKTHQNFGPRKRMTVKGQEVTSKKKDEKVPEATEILNHEDEMLQKSRMILEAKAKIYDQIVEKKVALDEEFSDNYLVDFQRKELLEHSADVQKSDSKPDHMVNVNDSENVVHNDHPLVENSKLTSPVSVSYQSLKDPESQSSHSSNLGLAEKTEMADCQNTDGPIHYQNVQFNEIRDHGVGYFAFSQEEKERQEQMELLKNLRQETIGSKQANEKFKQKKQALLQSRLAKVCQRRNIDSSVLQAYSKKEEEIGQMSEKVEAEQSPTNPTDEKETTSHVPDANLSSKKVRPWDIGKSNFDFPVQIPKKKQSGAEKWIEQKREERHEEFAPPSFYYDDYSEPKMKKFCQDQELKQ